MNVHEHRGTLNSRLLPHIVQPLFTRETGSRYHEIFVVLSLILRSNSTTERTRVISKFPLQIHRECAPDDFLCVRGATASRVGGRYDDHRWVVRGCDKRPVRIRARARDAPPSGKSIRSKECRIGNLTHLIRCGYPLVYVYVYIFAAVAAAVAISTLRSS